MGWPHYRFIDLSPAEKQVRRQTLDGYALYAQLSALLPVAAVLLFRLAKCWVIASRGPPRADYVPVPSSPVFKVRRRSRFGVWRARFRRARWWLGEDVAVAGFILGQRDRTCCSVAAVRRIQSRCEGTKLTAGQNGLSAFCGPPGFCRSACWRQEKVSFSFSPSQSFQSYLPS